MTDIEQVRAALNTIDKLLDLLECSHRDNQTLLPLFSAELKRARAALDRMEPVKVADSTNLEERMAARIRALKEQP